LKQKSLSFGQNVEEDYNRCIDFGAHPNERSITSNLILQEGRIILQLLNTEKGVFQACLLACVRCGVDAIRVFDLIYPNEFKRINADQRIRNIQEQFSRIALGPVYDLRNPTV